MSVRSPPWRRSPAGVWREVPGPAGASVLEEFGGETVLLARAWLVPPLGSQLALATLQERGRTWRMAPSLGGELTAWCDLGWALVELTLSDRSGLEPAEIEALHADARASLDLDAIASRAAPPRPIPAAGPLLVPWPLPPGHPLVAESVLERRGALGLAVAAIDPPWARILGPDDVEWAAPGPAVLWQTATLNLVRRAMAGEIPMTEVQVDGSRALRIGPHPLAVACLALPDLALLTADVVGSAQGLRAHPVRPDLLVVAGPDVQDEPGAWCPSMALASVGDG